MASPPPTPALVIWAGVMWGWGLGYRGSRYPDLRYGFWDSVLLLSGLVTNFSVPVFSSEKRRKPQAPSSVTVPGQPGQAAPQTGSIGSPTCTRVCSGPEGPLE